MRTRALALTGLLALGPLLVFFACSRAPSAGTDSGQGSAMPGPGDAQGWYDLLVSSDTYAQKRAAIALARIGAPAIPFLTKTLSDPRIDVRDQGVAGLAGIGPPAMDALGEAIKDPDRLIRQRGANALIAMGPAAIPVFEGALHHSHHSVREDAALALGHLGPPAIDKLTEALDDPDPRVWQCALDALGQIGPPAVPALEEARRRPERSMRAEADRILKGISTAPSVVPIS